GPAPARAPGGRPGPRPTSSAPSPPSPPWCPTPRRPRTCADRRPPPRLRPSPSPPRLAPPGAVAGAARASAAWSSAAWSSSARRRRPAVLPAALGQGSPPKPALGRVGRAPPYDDGGPEPLGGEGVQDGVDVGRGEEQLVVLAAEERLLLGDRPEGVEGHGAEVHAHPRRLGQVAHVHGHAVRHVDHGRGAGRG